jgi:CrcB protein
MSHYILIFFGAGLGGIARAITQELLNKAPYILPFGTITVNLLGCYTMGLICGVTESKIINACTGAFVMTGILGGFTTFSAFSMETVALLHKQDYLPAIANILISAIGGITLTYCGYRTIKFFTI